MKIFDFKLIEEAEKAGAIPPPNRAERRARWKRDRSAQRRGQRAYARAIAQGEKAAHEARVREEAREDE